MEIWVTKVLTIVPMLLISLTAGLVPIKLVQVLRRRNGRNQPCDWAESRSRAQEALSYLNCLAGGVFLGTSLLHLFPEVQENAKAITKTDFPLAGFIVGCGLFLIMLVEHCIMQLQHHQSDVPYEQKEPPQTEEREDTPLKAGTRTRGRGSGDPPSLGGMSSERGYGATTEVCQSKKENSLFHQVLHQHIEQKTNTESASVAVTEGPDGCVHVIHSSHHHHHHSNVDQLKGLRSFVLLLALSLHAVFEGLALGLQTSQAEIWSLFAAVILHKIILFFSMGLQFAENLQKVSRVVLFMILVSFMAPIGIAIGTAITAISTDGQAESNVIANFTLQGLATGTFIYVTFFEVLPKEVGQNHNVLKVLAVIVGFGIISVVMYFLPA